MLPADLGNHKPIRISCAKTQWVGIAARRRSKTLTRNIPRFNSRKDNSKSAIYCWISVEYRVISVSWAVSDEGVFQAKNHTKPFSCILCVFFICSLYSPVDSSANRGQSYGIRSLLQGKRISCLVWDNLAQVTLSWNNCNDLVSHQVTGKPRSVCSKETR